MHEVYTFECSITVKVKCEMLFGLSTIQHFPNFPGASFIRFTRIRVICASFNSVANHYHYYSLHQCNKH